MVNKGQGKLSQKDQNPLLRGVHWLSPSNDFLVFRDIFKPNNCGRDRFYVLESKVSKESLLKVFFCIKKFCDWFVHKTCCLNKKLIP